MNGSVSEAAYWERLYLQREDEWDLGAPAPPLVRTVKTMEPAGSAVVLGCGRGYEAGLLAAAGWRRVVGVDFAPVALSEAQRILTGVPDDAPIEWRLQDLFTLPHTDSGHYDLVLEHTCFCAIDPARRAEWAEVAARILRPQGRLLALFYTHDRAGGPPFGSTRAELEGLLAPRFELEQIEVPTDSIPRRHGAELLVVGRKR